MSASLHQTIVRIKRLDETKRVAYGEVYAPNVLDTYGEFMTSDDVEEMAHKFAQLNLAEAIDTQHDNQPNGSFPVESFIARQGDPDFFVGSWVLGIKVPDDHIWSQVLKGDLNGFSFEALVYPVDAIATVSVMRDQIGLTGPSLGGNDDGHTHTFFVQVNGAGRVLRGATSVDDGHSHDIRKAVATVAAGEDRHTHRFLI